MTLLETERLLLRPFLAVDVEELLALYADVAVSRYLGNQSRSGLVAWLRENQREWKQRGYGRIAIIERSGGRFLGRGGLRYWPQFDETEVGWALRPEVRGHGYATEAARAALEWGFERFDFPYVTAMIHPDNRPSLAVADRLGMTPLREDTLFGERLIVHASWAPPIEQM